MMNKRKNKFFSLLTVFVVAILMIKTGTALAEDLPSLHFGNEKVTGLTVTKEIYRNSLSSVPLRSGTNDDIAYYNKNQLSKDEFIMYLYGGASPDNMTYKKGITYTRTNQYGNYYSCMNYDTGNGTFDLIIRPVDSNGNYEVYYYDTTNKRQIYRTEQRYPGVNKGNEGYSALGIDEKFKLDYANGSNLYVTKQFVTGSDGQFYLFDGNDGDQVYFKNLNFTYYYITENISLLETLNDKKINDGMTGIYDINNQKLSKYQNYAEQYKSADANAFEVQNYFDKPNDAFTVRKTINYFAGTNPVNEEFTFELLINNENPGGYSYTKYEGDNIIETNVFDVSQNPQTPAVIKLKGGQRIEITGIMKNTPIEVREIISDENGILLNPCYSAVTNDSKGYKLVTKGNKRYILWEGLFEKNKVDNSNFVNIPNVMSVKKTVTNISDLSDYENYEFEFEVLKYDELTKEYINLADNRQLKYYLCDSSGNLSGDSSKNDAPYTTSNGKFRLHHGETAFFTELSAGEKFCIKEKQALYNGLPVTVDFKMDSTVYEKEARPSVVDKEVTLLSDEIRDFRNTYDKRMGLNVSKTVTDNYKRSNPNAEYKFRLEKKDNNNNFVTVNNNDYLTNKVSIKIGNTTTEPTGEVIFKLKDGETANISNLKYGTYRVVEVNPNASSGTPTDTDPNPQNEEHLFITDVQVSGQDVKTVNKDKSSGLTDVESEPFELGGTDTKSVFFNNKVRELKYYFDIEKIIFIDKNIHGESDDTEQRFVFKVERFAEGQTNLTDENVLECFYVDLNCDTPMYYNGDENVTWKKSKESYPYSFYHKDDNAFPQSFFTYENSTAKVQKIYNDVNTKKDTQYKYPCSIWNGRRTVMVTKKGIYRISEVDWGGTDYDFWNGSNQYKGYGSDKKTALNITDGDTQNSNGYVIFSVADVNGESFKNLSAQIDNKTVYRPTASFTNSETEFAYLSSQTYAKNIISH
ncbi:MAG: hypothetical protein SPE43_00930 [Ruminococcus sp.]|nr:hypothetical protein [Ruminococcus sp.]